MPNDENVLWAVQVKRTLDDAVNKMIEIDTHSNKSEFIRDAVRRYIEELEAKNAGSEGESKPNPSK